MFPYDDEITPEYVTDRLREAQGLLDGLPTWSDHEGDDANLRTKKVVARFRLGEVIGLLDELAEDERKVKW